MVEIFAITFVAWLAWAVHAEPYVVLLAAILAALLVILAANIRHRITTQREQKKGQRSAPSAPGVH